MDVKQLRKIIRESVRKEVKAQREEIIKEIKAELFDILMSKPKGTASEVVTENVNPPTKEVDRSELRNLFERHLGSPGDTVVANTQNVPVTNVPSTFEGQQVTDKHKKTIEAINKDYSQLMKKMNLG